MNTYQSGDSTVVVTSFDQIKAALTEWDRRYREDPEQFLNDAARLLNPDEDEYTYGAAAAPYFLSILAEVV